ncbi:hypothetical protein [Pseudonocardia alni]|uniref:hypothetical protein n=1 Tax=Pseudonocardia alni TaxID=33907 RepID=UPI001AD756A0|nr:hypothetical protein [Pseudonocardia alni]MBO4239413.1 hypothetical protein [Pseudonocardia alni]
MNDVRRVQLLCAWAGPATLVVALGGWALAGILPLPPGPTDGIAEIVAFYGSPTTRAGLVVTSVGMCLPAPLLAAISVQMLRMEGRVPILSFLQLLLGAVTVVLLLVPMLLLGVAGLRADRSPELVQLLHDTAWLLFLTPVAPFALQNVTIGLAVLGDRSGLQVFPRWSAYANFWAAFLFCPAVLAYFFLRGPFAWNGVFVFWLGTVVYAAWLFGMFLLVRRAVLTDPTGVVAPAPAATAPAS